MSDQLPPAEDSRDEDPLAPRRRRLKFRAWHRGTKEADLMLGHFVDQHLTGFTVEDIEWFERLMHENDVDIMAWITQSRPTPEAFDGLWMKTMQKLDYLPIETR